MKVYAPSGLTAITTGGTAQSLFAPGEMANGGRLANPTNATENLYFDDTGAAATATSGGTSQFIAPGGYWQWNFGVADGVSVLAATSAHAFQAARW